MISTTIRLVWTIYLKSMDDEESFLDTNILIDYLARRGQFFEPAAQIVQLEQQHAVLFCHP